MNQEIYHRSDKRWTECIPLGRGGIHNVPAKSSDVFVGRDEVMETLHRTIQNSRQVVISAIQGMGGVVKTELVMQYAKIHISLGIYLGGMVWTQARDQEVGIQIQQFAEHRLGIPPPEDRNLNL